MPMSAASTAVVMVPIAKIMVRDDRRPLDAAKVRELARSIRALGLLNPIHLTSGYELIAGWHRLEAF